MTLLLRLKGVFLVSQCLSQGPSLEKQLSKYIWMKSIYLWPILFYFLIRNHNICYPQHREENERSSFNDVSQDQNHKILYKFKGCLLFLNRAAAIASQVFIYLWLHWVSEKAMAPHSSVLAWRIPGMGEPGGLPSMGSHRVEHNWSDLAAAAAALSLCCYMQAFSSCSRWGLLSSYGRQASYCGGFSCCQTRALGCTGFSVEARGLNSCVAWPWLCPFWVSFVLSFIKHLW